MTVMSLFCCHKLVLVSYYINRITLPLVYRQSQKFNLRPQYKEVERSKNITKKVHMKRYKEDVPAWLKSGPLKSEQLKYYRSLKSLRLSTGMDR